MDAKTFDRLIKLLNSTESSNDHEALSALRHAASILKKDGITWEQLVRGTVHTVSVNTPQGSVFYGAWDGPRFNFDEIIREFTKKKR